ncbi:MAG: hypothetical protein U0Q16_27695 [Bryobacteraceae bacterium]
MVAGPVAVNVAEAEDAVAVPEGGAVAGVVPAGGWSGEGGDAFGGPALVELFEDRAELG